MGCCDRTAQCSASSDHCTNVSHTDKKKIKHRLADYSLTADVTPKMEPFPNQMDPIHECIWGRDYRKCLENIERGGGDWRNLQFIVFEVDQCESASSVS